MCEYELDLCANMSGHPLQECPTGVSQKSVPQECPVRVTHKSVLKECLTRVSRKSVL